MKNSVMKAKMSNILKVSLLVFFTSLLPLTNASAQSAQKDTLYYKLSGVPIEVGDSVQINPDSLFYRTGERKSTWVYDKVHTVMQVGGKRHPDAVLLKEIYSWVEIGSIEPMNKMKRILVQEEIEARMNPVTDTMVVADTVAVIDTVVHVDTVVVKEVVLMKDTVVVEEATSAHTHRLSAGLRGGFASTLAGGNNGLPVGFDAFLDLRYAYYWTKENKPSLGIMTGVSIGYLGATQSIALNDEFTLVTDGGDVKYAVTAEQVKEKTHHVLFEVPVMFSMITPKGIFLNVGPKLILPAYSKFNQTITNPNITAYLSELNGKPIVNEVVMGKVLDEQMNLRSAFKNEWKMSLALGAEFGYALKFNNGHSLDMGVYLDYSVFNAYKNDGIGKVIAITPPSVNGPAVVDVQSMTDAWATHKGLFDVGVKVAYNFDIAK